MGHSLIGRVIIQGCWGHWQPSSPHILMGPIKMCGVEGCRGITWRCLLRPLNNFCFRQEGLEEAKSVGEIVVARIRWWGPMWLPIPDSVPPIPSIPSSKSFHTELGISQDFHIKVSTLWIISQDFHINHELWFSWLMCDFWKMWTWSMWMNSLSRFLT